MAPRRELSIRARLTLFFVLSVTVVLGFTGVALVNLVHRSLVNSANNQVQGAIVATQDYLAHATLPDSKVALPIHGDVVIQVTNAAGTTVWAASSPIVQAPVLAVAYGVNSAISDYQLRIVAHSSPQIDLSQLTQGQVQPVSTSRGPGLVFGFVYGTSITHSVTILLASVVISFPLLMLLAGALIWYALGLALAPVEAIRRRVERIASRDLSERVPVPGGDDEIARLARTLNAMLNRLEAGSKFQQEFVSNASHELRSPLTTLLATVERAANDPQRADWPAAAETIRREGRRLDGLIDDLFWLARHDENQIEVTSVAVDLDDLLFEEAERVRAMSDLTVDTSAVSPTRVFGDPRLLKRMIRNVVDNAARHAREGLVFTCSYDGDVGLVTVADDGEGIDVEMSARFFERFVRADPARDRQTGGTGLGLSIVTDIVNRYGGSARFVDVERGSKIELRVRVDGQRAAP
ncbi:MAG: HAMP domain-containing protein [Acidobacteriota bacterium]|nr:HAMP domain-containing protein [Acidobacteriota bacterium]